MDLSIFLAKVIGVSLSILSMSMLVDRRHVNLLFDVYQSPAVVYITGFLEVFLGMCLVVSHNIWSWDFRIIITGIGWMILLRGIGRVFLPERISPILKQYRAMEKTTTALLVFVCCIGVYLAYSGFSAQ